MPTVLVNRNVRKGSVQTQENKFGHARGEQQPSAVVRFAYVQEERIALARFDQGMLTKIAYKIADRRVLGLHTGETEASDVRKVADVFVEKCGRLAQYFTANGEHQV